jgi:Tol biopolymer transport system component
MFLRPLSAATGAPLSGSPAKQRLWRCHQARGFGIVVASLLLCLATEDIASAQLPEPIVYDVQQASGDWELWRANADGTNNRRIDGIATKRGDANEPTLSPDGSMIVFSDAVDLYKANVNGTGMVKITNAEYVPLWCSPECGYDATETYTEPELSPDGTKIVVTRQDQSGSHPERHGVWTMNLDGTGLKRIIPICCIASPEPTWSPDGQRVAFEWSNNSVGVVNADGSNLVSVPVGRDAIGPSWSPDGSTIAYSASGDGTPFSEIWTVRLDSGVGQRLTATDVSETHPDWSPDGSSVLFSANGSKRELRAVNADGTNYRTVLSTPGMSLYKGSFRVAVGSGPPPPPSIAQLLTDYVPQLRYDQQETYRADSAATITDNVVFDSKNRLVRRNSLRGQSGGILATSYFKEKSADLSLGFLDTPTYANGVTSSDTDYLDEEGTDADKAIDAQRMHGYAAYANQIYGRVVPYTNGQVVLQYWLWYYYNSKAIAGIGLHEGDWEMVTVVLGSNYVPQQVAYAQHTGGERCDWTNVQRTASGRPVAYVAQDSHATYFSAGDHDLDAGAVFDNADGLGGAVTPSVTTIDASAGWAAWPGRWGSSMGGGLNSASPHGPGHGANTDAYNDPLAWSNGISGCTEEQSNVIVSAKRGAGLKRQAHTAVRRPPAPRFSAKRRGESVVIRYRFLKWPKGRHRRPIALLTSVDPAGDKYPPLTVRTPLNGRRKGRITRPLGAGKGPFKVLVSAEARSGVVSRTVTKPLR